MHGAESRREPSAREKIRINGSSRKVGGANKGLGEAPKSCTRKEHESATNSIAKRGQGAIAPCRVKGQRPLWGLGQRPNCSAGDHHRKRTQQRRRQRSVPASNFARPQTRPQSCSSPRFREEPNKQTNPPCSRFLHCMGDCFLADYLPSVDSSSLRTAPSTYTCAYPLAFSPLIVTVYLPGVFGTMLKLLVGSRLPV